MMNLTTTYKPSHATGLDCRVTNLRNLMQFFGHRQSYSTIYGMSAGLDFGYRKGWSRRDAIEYPHFDFTQLFYATTGLSFHVMEQLAFTYGAVLRGNYPDTAESSWQTITGFLAEGLPVMLAVSRLVISRFLGRIDGFPEFLQKVRFGGHWVVITALDVERRVATLFETDMLHPFEIPLEVLDEARTAGDDDTRCLMKSANRWVLFVPPSALPSSGLRLRSAVSKVLYNMMERPSEGPVYCGIRGIQQFAEDLPQWGEMAWAHKDMRDASAFIFCLNGEVLSSGFGRRLYASFLKQASGMERSETLERASNEYASAAAAWRVVLANVQQALDAGDYGRLGAECTAALDEIVDHETLACAHLGDFLKRGD